MTAFPARFLRTRRGSLALPDGSNSGRPFSSSSASAGRTTSDSSSRTSLIQSARASAGTLSSHHTFASDDKLEVETVRDGSPTKLPSDQPSPLRDDSVAELEIAMSAVLLRPPSSSHRHSVSVPMDEGDSPRQHQEESWSRATGATQGPRQPTTSRVFMIHSPNEEASASPSSGRLSQATKDIAFGSIAGMVSKVFEHPFDLVKVRLQTQSADRPPRYAGAFDCFKQTYLQEGIRGLYRGLSMPVLGATLENACLFFTYNQIQSAIRWRTARRAWRLRRRRMQRRRCPWRSWALQPRCGVGDESGAYADRADQVQDAGADDHTRAASSSGQLELSRGWRGYDWRTVATATVAVHECGALICGRIAGVSTGIQDARWTTDAAATHGCYGRHPRAVARADGYVAARDGRGRRVVPRL